MRDLLNLIESTQLDEAGAGPARIIQHIRNGQTFLMLSAFRADLKLSENKRRTDLLRGHLARLPVAYIVTGGEYHEIGQDDPSEETSFFIMPRNKIEPEAFVEFGVKLMKIFNQDSILFGDGENVNLIEQNGDSFSIGNAASFDPAVVKKAPAYSKIKNRKFTFTSTDDTPAAAAYGNEKKVAGSRN